ncbi:MAG: UDP-N-acetylmuramoyl-tripeptide--D-alanyl-D-alanine ligase [Pseudomonadota bacterium]
MTLWTSRDAVAATGGRSTADWACTGVSIDTRTLEEGDLFVALKDVRDGHAFVADALAKGAAAAMVSHVPADLGPDAPLLIVADVLAGLEALGKAGRARSKARVAAVTGSVGKTSTKEMLRSIFSAQGQTHASHASYNNHWGVPLTLARLPQEAAFAVIEIGMNHPGEIAPLSRMTRPDVAMLTTIAAAHLEAFDDINGIAVEKASIFEGVPAGGVAVINADIAETGVIKAKASACRLQTLEFGEKATDFRLHQVQVADDVTVVQAEAAGTTLLFKLATPGRHFAMNALGALAVAEALGADLALACQSLGRWTPYEGRGVRERIQLDLVDARLALELIDDSYNANPTSMAAALDVLAAAQTRDNTGRVNKGRRIAFLGDMRELGPKSQALHEELAKLEALTDIDVVHCIGPQMGALHSLLPEAKRGVWTETAEEMVGQLRRVLDSGDVVLAKGSLSMQLSLVVDAIRKMGHPHDNL